MQKESLEIICAVLLLRPYLADTWLTIRTGHDFLGEILNLIDSIRRLALWRLRLPEFDFGVVRHAGMNHQPADALSTFRRTGEDDKPFEDNLTQLAIDAKDDNTNMPVINVNSSEIILLNRQEKKSIDTLPTVVELVVERACVDYCKVGTLNFGRS